MWKLKNPQLKTIKDVVLFNTGMTEEELQTPREKYSIDKLDEATRIIKDAVAAGTPISVVGDYDADGICASAIMWMLFRALNVTPKIRIPRRFSEGYGLSESIIDELKPGLLITVDNGIVAHAAIQKAKDKGFTVIVTDHHLSDGISLPCADVLIDPSAIPGSADFSGYCGAGIAYKLAIEVLGEDHPLIPTLLSFAAIATVADVMPLTHENRFIVKEGLKSMVSKGRTVGLYALLERCGFSAVVTEKDIGFKIAPMLNAPGRLVDDGAMTSLRMLVYHGDIETARTMADELHEINESRKAKKAAGLEILEAKIEEDCMYGDVPLCIYVPGLDEGLVGIYAGSLAETHKTPCFVFTDSEEEGVYKGSARSHGGVHLKNLLDKNADILYKYGGHAEAAGVSVKKENFEEMRARFMESIGNMEIDDTRYYDLEINAQDIPDTIAELQKYAPFGMNNPEPIFFIKNYTLTPGAQGFHKNIGENKEHLKLFNSYAGAIGFGMSEKYNQMKTPRQLEIYGTLSTNFFMGKTSNQVELLDMQAAQITTNQTTLAALLAKKAAAKH